VNIVFAHRRGAGQFRFLAGHLAERGVNVTVVCEMADEPIRGVRFVKHDSSPVRTSGDSQFRHLAVADEYARHGHRVAETLDRLRRAEGAPDIVIGHIGWGGLLFVKDVLPQTPALGYCEYFFRSKGGDIGFDPRQPASVQELGRARLRNMIQQATLEAVDAGLSPTAWQRSRYPANVQPRIAVCHEGVDTAVCRPDERARFQLPDGRTVSYGDAIVTYVARGLEPYRGFPQFMRAAASIAKKRNDVLFLIVGDDTVSYGRTHPSGRSWRQVMMAETGIDPNRIVFLGPINHAALVRLFQVSAVHVYLTVPFVLSWSLLEAMACGCLVVGSKTAPVEEVIADRRNGILTDFWDTDLLANRVLDGLARPGPGRALRQAARATIEQRYRRSDCLARQVDLLGRLISGAARARLG
jgi:glycosyltransferase involved in cell wall biosynthesis